MLGPVERRDAPTPTAPDFDEVRRRAAAVVAQGRLLQQELDSRDLPATTRATREISDRLRAEAAAIRAERTQYGNVVMELRHLVAQLEEALSSRAVIEQAKGVIMAQSRCTPNEAFDMLRRASQRTNRKVRDLAVELVRRAQTNSSHP